MKFDGPKAHECSASKLLDVLSGVSTSGSYGWNVDVSGVMMDRSELDKKVTFSFYGKEGYEATRRVTISPEWSVNPRYGEPETFLGYHVEDDAYTRWDGEVARHVDFDEALEAVEARIVSKYGRGPEKMQQYDTYRGRAQYDNLDCEDVPIDAAIDSYVGYFNSVKLEDWDVLEADDVDPSENVNQLLAAALREGLVDSDGLCKMRVCLVALGSHDEQRPSQQ